VVCVVFVVVRDDGCGDPPVDARRGAVPLTRRVEAEVEAVRRRSAGA
jgi:hypothetical protein